MGKNKFTNKNFSEALRDLLDNKKITYRKFVQISDVSKTYLTEILVHHRVPSKGIIEKIAKALFVKPTYFKEYRILEIIGFLKKYSGSMDLKDIENLYDFIKRIKNKTAGEIVSLIKYSTGKEEMSFEPRYFIYTGGLHGHQEKIVNFMVREFRKVNEEELIEDLGADKLLQDMEQR